MRWLLKLYCLPGKLAVGWTYLFPRDVMQAVQSGRQRGSPFAHFIISTPVWAIVAAMAIGAIRDPIPEGRVDAQGLTQTDTQIASTADVAPDSNNMPSGSQIDTAPAEADQEPQEPAGESEPIALSPDNTPAIAAAMKSAFGSGRAERWKAGGQSGYAVPSSAEPTSGCRSIYYSIDGTSFQSEPQKVCA